MDTAKLAKEIAKRRAAITRAERTILEARLAPFTSEPTTLALQALVKVVAAEHIVLERLTTYRVGLIATTR
ncbi:MAG: hypothetical protein ABMA14_21295 [Hyphomonadaceae bacterium]